MKHIDLDDLKVLKKFLKDKQNESVHSYAIEFILRLGLRGAELVLIRLDDLDFVNNEVVVRGLKNGENMTIGVSNSFLMRFQSFLSTQPIIGQDDPLFMSLAKKNISDRGLSNEIRIYFKRILFRLFGEKYKNVGLHSLRHSFALQLLSSGFNIGEVQHSIRHKSITNTMVYLTYGLKLDLKSKIKKAMGQ